MLHFEVDVEFVVKAVDRARENLARNIPQALQLGADLVAGQAKTVHEYTDRSGMLTNSIAPDAIEGTFDGGNLSVVVAAGAAYGLFVERGTRAHTIKPKYRKALRWPTEGGFVFARKVRHPGTAPRHFLANALDAKLREIDDVMQDATALSFAQAGFEVA